MGFFDKLFGKKDMDDEIEQYNRRADAAKQGASQTSQNLRYTVKQTTTTATYSTGVPPQMSGTVVSSSEPQTHKTMWRFHQTSDGGYDMKQTMRLIEALYTEILQCTEAQNNGTPMPPRTNITMPAEVKHGFRRQEVDGMVAQLNEIIERMRSGG